MAQNIYDNPEFFAGYSQLPRQVHGLAGAPEWPAIRAMLPDLKDKRIIDMGCGFGWFARWTREYGAQSVVGLDISEKMIVRAKADTPDSAIKYRVADLEVLELPLASFDFAYSALTFHYIEDFDRLVRMVHRSLTPGLALRVHDRASDLHGRHASVLVERRGRTQDMAGEPLCHGR